MSDLETLQGLWRIQSSTSRGDAVIQSATHYLIVGNSMKEIVPSLVDDGKLRATINLDETTSPRRMIEILDYNGPNGPPDPDPIVLAYLYRLEGDTLTLCSGIKGEFPNEFSDEYSIKVLVRDRGPVPEFRKPSGTPPIADDVLGTLRWDDNLSWFGGDVDVGGATIDVSLNPKDGTDVSDALTRARQVFGSLERYRKLVADYAVEGLLELKNDNWRDEDEETLSADEFKRRMTLRSVGVEPDGSVTFWHDDGDLFWGHSIQVCVDAEDNCTGTDIPG